MHRDPAKFTNQEYDVLVIGGGIYGACIAWDSAQRGLSVALIERGDFGQETSANSLKTVHGGLRYLQDFDLKLVRMMIEERSSYLRIASHLVQPLRCITPTYKQLTKSRAALGTALKINDLAGYDRNSTLKDDREIPSSHLLSKQTCQEVLPGLPIDGVTGAALWHDAQIYDTERLTLAFITSATNAGADASNYVEAIGFQKQGSKITGVKALDIIGKKELNIRSKVVVNAAGPWIDSILGRLDLENISPNTQPSLAINIITKKLVKDYAAGVASWPGNSGDESNHPVSHMLFISPWRDYSIIGTFHSHYQGDPDNFSLQAEDLQNIILEVNSAYPAADLKKEDIKFVHYGFLPENSNPSHAEVKLVRKSRILDHHREDGLSGLISVIGVKYTTARHTAEKTVDLVFKYLEKEAPSSKTSSTPVHGGQIDHFGDYLSRIIQDDSAKLAPDTIDHWVRSYGAEYNEVMALLRDSGDNSRLSLHSAPVINAQVIYAIREEMALRLSDVVLRRTGIGTAGQPDDSILELIAQTMATELGWSQEKTNLEIEEMKTYYRKHGLIDPVAENLENS